MSRTVTDTGTLFSVTDGNSSVLRLYNGTNDWLPTTNWVIEFYVIEMDSSLNIYTSGELISQPIVINSGYAVGHTVKIKYDGTKIQLWYDDTPSTSRDIVLTQNMGIYFVKSWSVNSWNLKIKDLKAYPI